MNTTLAHQKNLPRAVRPGLRRGQSMAEFALMTPLFIIIIFIAITFSIIGQAALAVTQLAYNGARYAAVNPGMSASALQTYIKSGAIGSPNITGSNGTHTTVTVTQAGGFAQPVTVTVSYDLSSVGLISSMTTIFSALGVKSAFPTTLTATVVAMSD